MIEKKDVVIYLDDILVMGATVAKHNQILGEIVSRLSKQNLIVRFKKCDFGKEKIKFLGFIIGQEEIQVDNKKIEAIINWPPPTTVTELKEFLGLENYLRRFMPDYATISSPLTAQLAVKRRMLHYSWIQDRWKHS